MEKIIEKPELQILINLIQMRDKIRVSAPLYNMPLLEAYPYKDGYRVRALAKEEDFHKVLHGKERYLYDLPTYRDYYECFLSSGIINYANIDEFQKKLEAYKSLTRRIIFAPDTNLLYHAFLSKLRGVTGIQIAIVDLVKKEIENSMNFKYKHTHLRELRNILHNSHLLQEFSNRRMKKSRKAAYIALREYEKLKDKIIEVESIKEKANTNDELIIKTLKEFDKNTPALVVLLTADIAMTDIAEIEGVEYFLFEYPHKELSEHYASGYQLRTLIFNLAAVFGVIEMNNVLIFGEFRGKTELNELKLVFKKDLHQEFCFHWKLCKKLMELEIEK
ncbi:PIN domain-containing protein [Thermococcus aggregans]|uniref:PIN domain-containing protein n=1 Tax=Thermococcus aggregans TaxID=110163 RepID=A0A9E7SPA9_THEAG|nr:PIN domain-containing protein [Thermococcus aggregans]USS41110.1 PIN domain-containing protein [Thermococcus aggregans]